MGLLNVVTALAYLQDAALIWMHTLLLMRVRSQGRGATTDVSTSAVLLLLAAGACRVACWFVAPHMGLLLKLDLEGIVKEIGRSAGVSALLGSVLGGFYSRPAMHYACLHATAVLASSACLWHGWSLNGQCGDFRPGPVTRPS
jgi:hypothetical protein